MEKRMYVSDFPDLLKEWDYELNVDFSPNEITAGNSRKPIHWICSACGYKWVARAYNRSHLKQGCPECGKKKISQEMKKNKLLKGVNDLASQRPDLLLEWDYEKNIGLSPYEITIGNNTLKINWICSTCGHKWPATVASRVKLNTGCPECKKRTIARKTRERKFDASKSLCALYPDIAQEWHPTLNQDLSVEKAMPGSNDLVWWKCSICDYSYQAMIVNRTGYKHAGCPRCNRHFHTSFPEQAIFFYVCKLFPDAKNGFTDCFENNMELDIYIPMRHIGIEYDGGHWHQKETINRNKKKYESCRAAGIKLIRIKENYKGIDCDLSDADKTILRTEETDHDLETCIIELLYTLSPNNTYDIDVLRDRGDIRSSYITSFKEKSLLTHFPEIAKEWHPTLNGTLRPDMVFPTSHEKVWWLCSKCGQQYPASPAHKTRKEQYKGCPVCSGKKIVEGINDLFSTRPDLAVEWHPTLNGDLKPTEIAPNYSKKVWWKCNLCGNTYKCTPNKRVSRNQACPKCANKKRANTQKKAVINIDTGEIFEDSKEAAEKYNVSSSAIRVCCLGKTKTCRGFHWAYV